MAGWSRTTQMGTRPRREAAAGAWGSVLAAAALTGLMLAQSMQLILAAAPLGAAEATAKGT